MAVKEVVAAGFIIFRRISSEIQYLLLQTSYGEKHWTPPKGHVDNGESELEAAWRETKEEADLDRDQLHIIPDCQKTLRYEVRGKPKRVVYWLAELKEPDTQVTLSEEHIDFKWLKLEDANKLIDKYKDMQSALNETEELLRNKVDKL